MRYADDHSREPRIDEARAERDQLKQVVADLQSRLERSGGETARRRELDCLKDDLREAENQRCGEVEEKEACIAELQQIILNRDESIEVYKKEQQRLQENLRHVSDRLQGAEAAGAAASAALQEAQSQLQVQHAGSSSEKELLLHAQMHELSAQLLDAEERLRVRSQDGAQALEEERHRRLTEAESLSSSIGRLERSMELLVKALKSASRRDEGHAAVVKQLKQELGDAQSQLACSGAERDRNMTLLARENGEMSDMLQMLQQQVLALNQEAAEAAAARRQLEGEMQRQAAAHERSIKQVVDLEKHVDDLKSDTTRRVVVVTPKICVSVAPGQIEEIGKLDLPASVLQKLVAKQLGYDPDELFKAEDESSLSNINFFERGTSRLG